MNEIQVTLRGNITTELRTVEFDDGNIITSFRMASNARRFDSQAREWVNAGTTFVNVNCRRAMAVNVQRSLAKGQPVVVTGKLRERVWEKDGRSGRTLEIEADGLGHDLAWGTATFSRVVRVQVRVNDEEAEHMAGVMAEQEDHELTDLSGAAVLDDDDLDAQLDDEIGDLDDADDASRLGRELATA